MTRVVEQIRGGGAPAALPTSAALVALHHRLEWLTKELVNKVEADVVAGIEASSQAYRISQMDT